MENRRPANDLLDLIGIINNPRLDEPGKARAISFFVKHQTIIGLSRVFEAYLTNKLESDKNFRAVIKEPKIKTDESGEVQSEEFALCLTENPETQPTNADWGPNKALEFNISLRSKEDLRNPDDLEAKVTITVWGHVSKEAKKLADKVVVDDGMTLGKPCTKLLVSAKSKSPQQVEEQVAKTLEAVTPNILGYKNINSGFDARA